MLQYLEENDPYVHGISVSQSQEMPKSKTEFDEQTIPFCLATSQLCLNVLYSYVKNANLFVYLKCMRRWILK